MEKYTFSSCIKIRIKAFSEKFGFKNILTQNLHKLFNEFNQIFIITYSMISYILILNIYL
jgi:hypothetical protein